jgi:hypothetical protein
VNGGKKEIRRFEYGSLMSTRCWKRKQFQSTTVGGKNQMRVAVEGIWLAQTSDLGAWLPGASVLIICGARNGCSQKRKIESV